MSTTRSICRAGIRNGSDGWPTATFHCVRACAATTRTTLAIILKDEWTRIFIFAGLTREGLNTRYLARLRGRIFELVLAELRHEYAITDPSAAQLEQEVELIWGMHAAIFYVGMRKWVYGLVVPDDIERLIEPKRRPSWPASRM